MKHIRTRTVLIAGALAIGIAIPAVGSLYLTHSIGVDEVRGLKAFPREDRPPVAIVYFAFRVMVGIGLLMLLIVALGWFANRRGRLY